MKQVHQGRAKQFMPFAALKGFEDMISGAEQLTEPRRELSETQESELSESLRTIKKGDKVRVTHYLNDRYITTCAELTELDAVFGFIKLGSVKVCFGDIVKIESNEIMNQ